jgi:hypothetical protein
MRRAFLSSPMRSLPPSTSTDRTDFAFTNSCPRKRTCCERPR